MSDEFGRDELSDTDIAIIGMAGRFAGANTPEQLWENVRNGVVSIVSRSDEDLIAAGVNPALIADPDYVKRDGLIADVDCFDAAFFDIGPRDAAMMDPQHRHFLEISREALERAGHVPEKFPGAIGAWAGSGMNSYLINNLLTNPEMIDSVGMFLVRHTANDKDFLTTGVSYRLNLTGPSVNVQTACSTSLVAVHLASQALLNGECDMALAGGVTINVPHGSGYLYREGEVLSPDGVCHAFDAESRGTVLTSGAGVVVLRRLADALKDGDHIHAVIKASALNNDGSGKVGYLAPSVDGHAAVIAEALAVSGVEPASIGLFEAHGTGTAVGDPIEVAAARQAFAGAPRGSIRIGSTKPNIGHTDTAAGVVSLMKAAMAIEHATLPPMAAYTGPNALIDLESTPFELSGEPAPWRQGQGPRRAALSSLGVGGTNAHAILEEAPAPLVSDPGAAQQAIVLSAKTPAALERMRANLAAHLREHPQLDLADVAFTLQEGRSDFRHRMALAASTVEEAAATLEAKDARRLFTTEAAEATPSVVFMFPGGGAQYPNMGRELYETEPVYRTEIDRCLSLVTPELAKDMRRLLFPEPGQEASAAAELERPSLQLPAIVMTEYALARLWMSWGIQPAAMTGHSLGEYTAACLAGVLSLRDALAIVALRGRLVERVPNAAMLSIPLTEPEVRELVNGELSLAAVNGPGLCVVSGAAPAVATLERTLTERNVESRRIKIIGAGHCALLDPMLAEFEAHMRTVPLSPPRIPYVSNVTGDWVKPEDATNPAYWVRHLRHTVRFADGLATLLADPNRVLIEVGPGTTMSSLARQQPVKARAVIPSLPHPQDAVSSAQFMIASFARAWAAGVPVEWARVRGTGRRQRVILPPYPFERTRHWIEPGKKGRAEAGSIEKIEDLSRWFWRPSWRREDHATAVPRLKPQRFIIFEDSRGIGAAIERRLRADGHSVTRVSRGDRFQRLEYDWLHVRPGHREDYEALLEIAMPRDASLGPCGIVHCWALDLDSAPGDGLALAKRAEDEVFGSLMHLGAALAAREAADPVTLTCLTTGAQSVDGEQAPHPEASLALGPLRVLPREAANIACRMVDIELPAKPKIRREDRESLAGQVAGELSFDATAGLVAFRGGKRWTVAHEPMPMPETREGARLKDGGVYLITGGLGELGLEVAEHLAHTRQARLVLVNRSGLPADADAWLAAQPATDPTSRRILRVRALEAAGAEVEVAVADVASAEAMREAVACAMARFGRVDGVFHTAGVVDDALIQMKTPESAAAVLAPKVTGTLALEAALREIDYGFLVLFSSTSGILGLEGQVDYTAANAFLDAFATSRRASGNANVFAIDWGIWRDAGIAARAIEGRQEPVATVARPTSPGEVTLAGPRETTGDIETFRQAFDASEDWLLDEHRLADGTALMPGTGYLAMVAQAANAIAPGRPIEIRNVFFLAPLEAGTGPVPTQLTLSPAPGGAWEMTISSMASTDTGARFAQDHCTAEVSFAGAAESGALDLTAVRSRLGPDVTFPAEGAQTRQERHLRFGPRWHTLVRARYGEAEALAELALPAEFHADLAACLLHPALLDIATSVGLPLIPGYETSDDLFVPMSYRKLTVLAPLPARLLSYARLTDGGTEDSPVATFDVTVTDLEGNVLVEVEGFTVRRAAGIAALGSGRPAAGERAAARKPQRQVSARMAKTYAAGILPAEGMEALERVLANATIPSLVVSSIDLDALRREAVRTEPTPGGAVKVMRPDLGEFADPRDALERDLVEAWQELLGIDRISIHDDFFELGGHSLIAVRLFNRIKQQYGLELGLAMLFETPTVAKLGDALRAQGVVPAEGQETAPVSADEPVVGAGFSSLVPIQPNGSKRPFFCIHGMYGNVLNFRDISRHLGNDQPFYGLQQRGLDGREKPRETLEAMAADYLEEIRRLQPEGPYLIGGYSGGGLIAFEMAHQMLAAGAEVATIVMLDTPGPWLLDRSLWVRLQRLRRRVAQKGPGYLARRLKNQYHQLRMGRRREKVNDHGELLHEQELRGLALGEVLGRACAKYTFRPVAARVLVLRADDGDDIAPDDLGWAPFADAVDVARAPGTHVSLMLEPNVRHVARALADAFERTP